MRRKIKIMIFGLLLLPGLQTVSNAEEEVSAYHLTGPVERVITIKGQEYLLKLYRYEPPYHALPYLVDDQSKIDCSTPEKTYIVFDSAIRKDKWKWYLASSSKKLRAILMIVGKKQFWDSLVSVTQKEGPSNEKWLFKAEYRCNGIPYQTVVSRKTINYRNRLITWNFIKEDGKWLVAGKLNLNPVANYLKGETYDKVMEESKKPGE